MRNFILPHLRSVLNRYGIAYCSFFRIFSSMCNNFNILSKPESYNLVSFILTFQWIYLNISLFSLLFHPQNYIHRIWPYFCFSTLARARPRQFFFINEFHLIYFFHFFIFSLQNFIAQWKTHSVLTSVPLLISCKRRRHWFIPFQHYANLMIRTKLKLRAW